MPTPKIFGTLNNSGLHALTPEIKEQINHLAKNTFDGSDYQEGYKALKDSFAEFYGLNKKDFGWKAFAALLNKYNETDVQHILGPVLRNFVRANMVQSDTLRAFYPDALEREAYIDDATLIQDSGRYDSLSPPQIFSFAASKLGFSLNYTSKALSGREELANNIDEISIYHSGGSEGAEAGGLWERTNIKENNIEVSDKDYHLSKVTLLCS